MNENDDTKQEYQTSTFEPSSYPANQSPRDDADERQPVKNYANELITNIIKDASEQASKSHADNFDNTNDLDFSQTSNHFDKSKYSTTNGYHNDNDFDNEDIQNKMNGVIQDLQPQSTDGFHQKRESITSNRLHDEQVNSSAPINMDSSSNNPSENPLRSMSESALVDQHLINEQVSPLPIRQDESQSDTGDFNEQNQDLFNTTITNTDENEQRPTSALKTNGLDATTRFAASPSPRVQSAASKRSVHVTPDEISTSGDEKRAEPPTTEIDLANQEVNNIVRRPSRALSPLDRPRSPTPNDSRKASVGNGIPTSYVPEQSPSLSDENQQNETVEAPVTIVSPASRPDSASQNDEQQFSRPTSAIRTNLDENSFEPALSRASSSRTFQFIPTTDQSKLITSGESLQIPIDELENERINSPPPSGTGIQSLALLNPLVSTEQSQSPVPGEKDRKSPTPSSVSNEKVLDGEVLSSRSRTHSNVSQQQVNNTDQKSSSRRGSQALEQTSHVSNSRRTSTSQQQQQQEDESVKQSEQLVPSRRLSNLSQGQTQQQESFLSTQNTPGRKESTTVEPQSTSKRPSVASEQQISSRRESTTIEQKTHSRQPSTASNQQPSSKRASFSLEQEVPTQSETVYDQQKNTSRNNSFSVEQKTHSRQPSTASNQQPSSRRDSSTIEQKTHSRQPSTSSNQQPSSKRASFSLEQEVPTQSETVYDQQKNTSRNNSFSVEQKTHSRQPSTASNQQPSSRRDSATIEQKTHSRQPSTASNQQPSSKRASFALEQEAPVQPETVYDEQKNVSRKGSFNSNQQVSSRRESPAPEQQFSHSRQPSFDQHDQKSSSKPTSRKGSSSSNQQISNRQENPAPEQQYSHSRQPSFDQHDQKSSSKPASRKASFVDKQENVSRRSSTNQDPQLPSSRPLSTNIQNIASRQSSRHNSMVKHEQQAGYNSDSRRSSANRNETNPSNNNDDNNNSFQQERTPSYKKQQQSKANSHFNTDETVVKPIIMDSSKTRQQNGKRSANADTSFDQASPSKLPPVNSSYSHEKKRSSDSLLNKSISTFNRTENKPLSSSQITTTTTSEDEQSKPHWTAKVIVPSIHLSDDDDDDQTPREDQPRPQSPNVEQIAERNPALSPSLVTKTEAPGTTTPPPVVKKQSAEKNSEHKRREKRVLRRSTSTESLTHIPLVDDKSLDSASDNNTDLERQRRRHIRSKKKDVETNTDQPYDPSQQRQRSFFDDKELSPQKPLKATKPLAEYVYPTRRRAQNKELVLTTPDTGRDTDTPTVRRTIKHAKDSNTDKDPVHVNVTVVVKKFASSSKDEFGQTTAEAFVEPLPQQYFEPVQRLIENVPLTDESKEKIEDINQRPRSIDQQQLKSSENKYAEQIDRHAQSDTEQIITDEQKKRRRPKRISRTSQTYECVFRRMEREQQQDLRATSDTEKTVQTKKSQLRPRKKSPKKNQSVFLSADSFQLEELLPKQFHQSRRNMSKSSSLARSLSPQGGKLLILRPTLPFHHTDAVNVQRVCLQYAIDLIPNENFQSGSAPSHRNKLSVLKQPEQTNNLPMISSSSSGVNISTNKSNNKEKSASYKSEDYTHQRKTGGAV